MGATTEIAWCDATFNPWRGCQHATLADGSMHPGCDHCYAETMSRRNPGTLGEWGADGVRVRGTDAYWKQPLKWDAAAKAEGVRKRVFCASLADVFEDWDGPILDPQGRRLYSYIDVNASASDGSHGLTMNDCRRDLFKLIDQTQNLDWLLLTKRPQNVRRMWPLPFWTDIYTEAVPKGSKDIVVYRKNVWLGTSISDQATADALTHQLYHHCRGLTPVLFLSAEPLLGPVKLHHDYDGSKVRNWFGDNGINWVIVGGESGPHARPMHPDWARSLRDQCQAAGVPFHFKQWGEWVSLRQSQYALEQRDRGYDPGFCRLNINGQPDPESDTVVYHFGKKAAGRHLDGRTWDEFPGGAS